MPCAVWVYPSLSYVLRCVRLGCRFYPDTVADGSSVRPEPEVIANRTEERGIFFPHEN